MDRRAEIERWFAARGVPQLIEGYTTEQRMDTRAVPYIAGWIVIGTVLLWGRRPALSLAENALGMAFVIGAEHPCPGRSTSGGAAVRRSGPGVRLDPLDIGMIGLVPAVAAAILHGSPTIVIGIGGSVLLGVGIIYLFTAFGLFELGIWATRHLRAQLSQIATLMSRTMPVLLILVVFLLFASELWQAAHALRRCGPGGGSRAPAPRRDDPRRDRGADRDLEPSRRPHLGDDHAASRAGTPAAVRVPGLTATEPPRRLGMAGARQHRAPHAAQPARPGPVRRAPRARLSRRARGAGDSRIGAGDVGRRGPCGPVLAFELFDEPRLVSVELLITAGLLGGVSALYFAGLALTDAAFRAEFHARVVGDVEQIMAVHAACVPRQRVRRAD